jgi:protein-L-isoaspartate(D-aspartate) O-methyltransferase
MTQLLLLQGNETVLEIGTGSGYQAAILGTIVQKVYTMERHTRLADAASVLAEFAWRT